MTRVSETYVELEISVSGVTREVEARVRYIHSPAFGAIVERGSGIPVSPPEPENAEILTVHIDGTGYVLAGEKPKTFDIGHLLTDAQIEAISNEILEQGA